MSTMHKESQGQTEQYLLLYGDQTVEKLPAVRTLVEHAQRSPAGRRFLRDACDIIQIEVFNLEIDERSHVDHFDTLLQLAESNAQADQPSEIVATILMNVARLGELILYAEEHPNVLGSIEQPTHIVAFCTGEIPAAVAAAARDSVELHNLSIEIVRVICRFARNIIRRSVLVDRTNGSWATTIVGVSPERVRIILDTFHQSQNIAPTRQINIGIMATGWLTLFGPPITTEQLFNWSKELDEASRIKTDAGGGVHLPNLPELDLDEVVGSSPVLDVPITHKAMIWSPYSCEIRNAATLRDLIRQVIPDITQASLHLSDTIDKAVKGLGRGSVQLVCVGYTPHLTTLQKSLQREGRETTVVQHSSVGSSFFTSPRGGSDSIAIVGMSGRFPGSENIQEYWKSMLDGERHIKEIPKNRFDLSKWFDETGKQKNATMNRSGAFLDRPGYFDNRLFNMSPREALQTDPLHRMFLTVSYEALEMAGYSPEATLATNSNRIATYFGQTSDDWRDIVLTKGVDIYYAPGICRAFAPGRLNYHFKWGGPSYSVDAACASSIATISLACSALLARECDTALAGGGSILDSPAPFAGLSRGGFLSPEKGCETFHDDADGYVRGEGVGVVVLKRLEDAVADNDNILGVVRGSARNYSKGASSITHPSSEAQQRLYQQILNQNAIDPASVSYVEMHGTGTQAGDFTEMSSVLSTFGQSRSKNNPLVVGAVKANIGHGEAAAGVCALIKTLMMFQKDTIPPQPGMPFKRNHRFPDLEKMNIHIPATAMPLPGAGNAAKRRIFLNSFDASGGNSCLLLEEAPTKNSKAADPRKHHVVTFSARTPFSLRAIKEKYLHYIRLNPSTSLADLAYTTTARRMHQSSARSTFTATGIEDFVNKLETDLKKEDSPVKKGRGASAVPSVVFAFTGQGSQYAGMAHQLWRDSAVFRRLIDSIQSIATALDLPRFIDLIASENFDLSEASPVQTQLAIVAVEIGLAQLWASWGVQPNLVIGHSLGEYAALCISGVLTVSDTLYLVGKRAIILVQSVAQNEYAMLAISDEVDVIRQRLAKGTYDTCEIACINAPKSTVVSGCLSEITALQKELEEQGSRSTLLHVPFGFHSKQMDPILDSYESCVKGVGISSPRIPIASTLLGDIVREKSIISPIYLRRQTRESVNFVGALRAAQNSNFLREDTLFLEMGPDPVCISLIRSNLGTSAAPRLLPGLRRNENNWVTTSNTLTVIHQAGVPVNWPEYHREFKNCLSLLDLPTYVFDEKDFWTSYPDPEQLNGVEPKNVSLPPVPAVQGFPTTTLQRVTNETFDGGKISVTFESSTSDPSLFEAIMGHAVAGVTICSSSIFSDMALSAARYACERLQSGKWPEQLFTISSLDIHRPIVVFDQKDSHTIQINAKFDSKTEEVHINFQNLVGKSTVDIGSCNITFHKAASWKEKISRTLYLISSRIDSLKESTITGKGHHFLRPVVYRLFSNVVNYGERFQGLDEVFLDSECHDVVGQVRLPDLPSSNSGHFLYNPYLLDAVVHVAGFLVNCGLKYSEDIGFLASSFESWHILKPISPNKTYTSYSHMEESANGSSLLGDVYVFDGKDLVCALIGLRFQKMKKIALTKILQSAAPQSSVKSGAKEFQSDILGSRVKQSSRNKEWARDVDFDTPPSSVEPSAFTTPKPSSSVTSVTGYDEPAVGDKFLAAVAAEVGCEISELEPDTVFGDLGVDSLMAITVIASIRNDTGVELPGSFFLDNPTVADATKALGADSDTGVSTPQFSPPNLSPDIRGEEIKDEITESSVPFEQLETPPSITTDYKVKKVAKPLSSIDKLGSTLLLQGSMSSADPPLFLLADGTGSVSSYIQLPALEGGRRIYGVESPFVRDPSAFTVDVSVGDLADAFITSIRKIQPVGPYIIGGSSLGAIHAFEVSRRLLNAGETVSELLLIANAAPVSAPANLKDLDISTEMIDESGIFYGTGRKRPTTISARQKKHLTASVRSHVLYEPQGFTQTHRPVHTTLVIASKGLGEGASAIESPLTPWIHASWGSSETLGWDGLVGEIHSIHRQDIDSFSLLKYPNITKLGQIISDRICQ